MVKSVDGDIFVDYYGTETKENFVVSWKNTKASQNTKTAMVSNSSTRDAPSSKSAAETRNCFPMSIGILGTEFGFGNLLKSSNLEVVLTLLQAFLELLKTARNGGPRGRARAVLQLEDRRFDELDLVCDELHVALCDDLVAADLVLVSGLCQELEKVLEVLLATADDNEGSARGDAVKERHEGRENGEIVARHAGAEEKRRGGAWRVEKERRGEQICF